MCRGTVDKVELGVSNPVGGLGVASGNHPTLNLMIAQLAGIFMSFSPLSILMECLFLYVCILLVSLLYKCNEMQSEMDMNPCKNRQSK